MLKKVTSLFIILIYLATLFPAGSALAESLPGPEITGVSPKEGSTIGGNEVEIQGSNFVNGAKVHIGGREATILSITPNFIKVKIPATAAVGAASVAVTNPDGQTVFKPDLYNYRLSIPDAITIKPAKGNQGTRATISGGEHGEFAYPGVIVKFGDGFGYNVEVDQTAKSLSVNVPTFTSNSPDKKVDVTILNPDGAKYVIPMGFEYVVLPEVHSVIEPFGKAGEKVTIKGKNFEHYKDGVSHNLAVYFGASDPVTDLNIIDDSTLEVTVPAGNGTVDVKVGHKTDPEIYGILKNGFSYISEISKPTIERIAPNVASPKGGSKVTIEGTDFRSTTDANGFLVLPKVTFGTNISPQVEYKNNGELLVTVPYNPGGNGKVEVQVENPDGAVSGPCPFEYSQTIGLLSITPSVGYVGGGTRATLKGFNFPYDVNGEKGVKEGIDASIFIGDMEVTDFNIEGEDLISLTTPPAGIYGIPLDVVVRKIEVKDGVEIIEDAVLTQAFMFSPGISRPKIESVTNPATLDASGPVTGGVPVELIISDYRAHANTIIYFETEEKALLVTPEGIEALGNNRFKITGVLPAMPKAGQYDVEIKNYDGGYDILRKGFIFKDTTMQVFGFSPPNDKGLTGVKPIDVYIVGVNFMEDGQLPKVFFVDNADDPKEVVEVAPIVGSNDSQLIITIPTNINIKKGRKQLLLQNAYGSVVAPGYFTFEIPDFTPKINRVVIIDEKTGEEQEARGPVTGGTKIDIFGEGFIAGAQVLIDGIEVTSLEFAAHNHLVAIVPPCQNQPGAKTVTVINNIPDPSTGQIKSYTGSLEKAFYYFSAPAITGVSPGKASIYGGNIITITGTQLYPGMTIQFGNEDGLIDEAIVIEPNLKVFSEAMLRFRVPRDVGFTPGNNYYLKITNTDGGTTTWEGFAFKNPTKDLQVDQISPNEGSKAGGTPVTITGQNFQRDAAVYFGWEPVKSINNITQESLLAVSPPNEPGIYDVTVMNIDDASVAIKEGGFHYKDPKTSPKITSITPPAGPVSGGTKLIIKGEDFWPTPRVLIGTFEAEVTGISQDGKTITALTKEGKVGIYDVMVINPDSSTVIQKNGFTYKPAGSNPEIIKVSPNKVVTQGGTTVRIEGKDFRRGLKVYLGSQEVPVISFDPVSQTILIKTLPHEEGFVDVTVLNADGGIAQREKGLQFSQPESYPLIKSITPDKGSVAGGTWVTLYADVENGGDFKEGCQVFFGGNEAPEVERISYEELRALTPPGTKGKVDVSVVNNQYLGSHTLDKAFEYLSSLPKITSIAPNQGSYLGGTLVTLLGTDFMEDAKIYIGDLEATVVGEVFPDSITISTPPAGEPPNPGQIGTKDVKIVNPDGEYFIVSNGFRYLYPDSMPKIISLDPNIGSTLGGMPVEIRGSGFREGAKVIIGGKEAQVISIDDNPEEGQASILIKTPAHAEGAKNVVVINYDGASDMLENGFTYQKPLSYPVITSITPKEGPTIGGTTVTITGTYFKEGIRVWFGSKASPQVEFVDYKTIRAVTPPGEIGNVDVLLLNSDMGQVVQPNGFKYIKIELPEIVAITPNEGPSNGGTSVTIKGKNLQKGVKVFIGAVEVNQVEFVDKETVKIITPSGELGWQEVKVINPDSGWHKLEQGFKYFKPRTEPDTPDWLDATMKDYETIKLSWSQVDFANYYEIYVSSKANGTYRFLDQTKETYYFVTKLEPDTRYYFKVRAVNELGVSSMTGYDYATTDDRTPKGYGKKTEANELIVTTSTDSAEVLVPSQKALSSQGYVIDLKGKEYQKSSQKITFKGSVLTGFSWNFMVNTNSFTLTINPLSILPPQFWYSSERKLQDIYSSLIITDLGQREAEKALKTLPKNAKILSGVYSLAWEIQEGKKKTPHHLFFKDFSLTMNYKASDVPKGKTVDIFIYNDLTGKWEAAKATKDYYYSRLTLELIKPEKFLIVAY